MTFHSATKHSAPVLQIVGYKNSGKTTLTAALVRRLKQQGYRVGTAKHDAHDFSIDTPGTDTWQHQEAGADVTAISSSSRMAILRSTPEPLGVLLDYMKDVDLVLVEGFKQEGYPKLALLRNPDDIALLESLTGVIAAAVWPQLDAQLPRQASSPGLPIFEIDDVDAIYSYIASTFL